MDPEPHSSSELLPAVYDDLRRLAGLRLAREVRQHSMQATALVHEAYLRATKVEPRWDGVGHFFAAISEAMRRILIENVRRKQRLKRGGDSIRQDVDLDSILTEQADTQLLELDEALSKLAAVEPNWARLVQLRFFAGLTIPEVARAMNISPRTADAWWAAARHWLHLELRRPQDS